MTYHTQFLKTIMMLVILCLPIGLGVNMSYFISAAVKKKKLSIDYLGMIISYAIILLFSFLSGVGRPLDTGFDLDVFGILVAIVSGLLCICIEYLVGVLLTFCSTKRWILKNSVHSVYSDARKIDLWDILAVGALIVFALNHVHWGLFVFIQKLFSGCVFVLLYLADTCNLQKVSNITPTHFRKVTEYWKSYKAPSTIQTELSGFRHYCKLADCKHKMPENKELKLPKREPKKYNRGWFLTEYQKAREIAELMGRFDVRDGLDLGWHLGLRIIETCQLKLGDVKKALGWGGPDIKGKGGQVRFIKIETEEQLELLKRLYREAKEKGLTDDDFIK